MRLNILAGVAVVLSLALDANAAIALTAVEVTGENTPAGYRSWDLVATTGADWTQSQILTNLTGGSFYQDDSGGSVSPNPAFIPLVPSLAFDTFASDPDS